jgi:hypothetical protein
MCVSHHQLIRRAKAIVNELPSELVFERLGCNSAVDLIGRFSRLPMDSSK